MVDAVSTLLKCLKNKQFISDIEKARSEVLTEAIKLREENDLFIRDAITGMGTILVEDLENHYYITTVKIGAFGGIITQAIIQRFDSRADIAAYAREGLIKRNLAEKTIQKLKDVLV